VKVQVQERPPCAATPTSAPGVPGICMDMGTWTGHVLWNLYHSWSCEVTMLGFGCAGAERPLLGSAGTAAITQGKVKEGQAWEENTEEESGHVRPFLVHVEARAVPHAPCTTSVHVDAWESYRSPDAPSPECSLPDLLCSPTALSESQTSLPTVTETEPLETGQRYQIVRRMHSSLLEECGNCGFGGNAARHNRRPRRWPAPHQRL